MLIWKVLKEKFEKASDSLKSTHMFTLHTNDIFHIFINFSVYFVKMLADTRFVGMSISICFPNFVLNHDFDNRQIGILSKYGLLRVKSIEILSVNMSVKSLSKWNIMQVFLA